MNILEVSQLTKTFGGLTAVSSVDFNIRKGEILGLIGPNGAGKTTVFNLITGIYQPDQGDVSLEGKSVVGSKPHVIAGSGIARTFQTIRLFGTMTVLENVMSGQHVRSRAGLWASIFQSRQQKKEEEQIYQVAEEKLKLAKIWHVRNELAKNLAYGDQRRLEIVRALATFPKLIILDEPAGGLNEQESFELMGLIKTIRDSGITVLLIEHDMSVVMNVSDRIVVLDNGEKIAEGTPEEIRANEKVIEAYLGKQEDDF
ncbi:ABC transporter ATP-binding protein [Metallumcola ferriviriculae]|uniref:ABC transporter ATP-binding protein n=1 Tax=Metallumcola ferriviriculae TaxID=3039180 RepID=A0AAU0UNJ1_9FIRM|nr:ABC transporter ATP-binding protein [Desulfitibacteraceae bacterium MK1]